VGCETKGCHLIFSGCKKEERSARA
jgi:hypothetical protein